MAQSIHNGVSKVLIDHVVVTVGDQLEATADRYQRLRFNLTERSAVIIPSAQAIISPSSRRIISSCWGFFLAVKQAGRICGAIHQA
jgi:hypothetical protein